MNKIKYNIKVGNFTCQFEISQIYEGPKMLRYAKSALKKMGFDYKKLIKEGLNLEITKCPFCESDSKYNILYNIDSAINQIEMVGIEYEVINGMKNYHCKTGRKNCPGSLLNPNSVEYISRSFKIPESEANSYLINRNKSPFYLKNHKTEEDYKNYQRRDLNWYLEKYGDSEGHKRFIDFKNKVSKGNSKNSLIEKYGLEGYMEIIKKKSICNLNFFIGKYGEREGKERFDSYRKSLGITKERYIEKFGVEAWESRKISIENKKSVEYFIQTLGYQEGIKAFNDLRDSFSFNKEKYILKYGEERWIDRWANSNKNFYSKEASIFFEILLAKLKDLNIELTNVKLKEDEFFIWDNEYRRIYFYDFYFESGIKKIIVEYDNNFWHPKEGLGINAWDKLNFISKFSKGEKIEYDERKNMWAKYKGYEVITLHYEGKDPLRKKDRWDNLLNQALKEIKQIIEC